MGGIVQARCDCGFESENLFLGGGMLNFETYCGVPVLCKTCGSLQVVNLLDPCCCCGTCHGPVEFYHKVVPRTAPELRETLTNRLFSWRLGGGDTLVLPDSGHLCPRCHEQHMRFVDTGRWD